MNKNKVRKYPSQIPNRLDLDMDDFCGEARSDQNSLTSRGRDKNVSINNSSHRQR